jgi:NitT/TauT family transport system permease protein
VSAHPVVRHYQAAALAFGTLAALALILEGLIRTGAIDRFTVPLPSEIVPAFWRVAIEESVPARFLATAAETLAAGVLLVSAGVPLGILLFRFRLLRAACETWVAALASAPIVLMYPLFLVVFGRSQATIVMMGFLAALPALVLKTLEGLSGTRPVLLDVAKSLKLRPAQTFMKVLLPAALPAIFAGLRIGLTFALINIVGIEFLINFGGLGQLVNELAERYDLPGTYAAIGYVILVSAVFFYAMDRMERLVRPGP